MRKKEKKNKQVLLSIFIAIIMVSSILGYMFGRDEPNTVKYNKVDFYQNNFLWATKINDKEVVFHNFPSAVEHINISDEIFARIKSTLEVDSTYDQNNSFAKDIALAQHSVELIMDDFFNIYLRKGMTTENEYNLPVITCKEATPFIPVLYFKIANQTSVYLENNCIIAEARNGLEFLKIKDRLLYGLFDIIE